MYESSAEVFGVPGFKPRELRGLRDPRLPRFRRYRSWVRPLNDRQLIKRYCQYLRGADRAQCWTSIERTMNACGLFQQQLGRLRVAFKELSRREIPPPSRSDAYLHIRTEEVYLENQRLFERIWRLDADELAVALRELTTEELGMVTHQRAELLEAHLTQRERASGVQNGRGYRRERLILHLWKKCGWRFTESEAEQLITILEGAIDVPEDA